MKDKQIEVLERALAREKAARKAAEQILEEKSRELYFKSQELEKLNTRLELLVKEKTIQLKGVFENIVDAYVVMNLMGDVLKMNEAAENLLGYALEEGVNLMQLVHPQEQEKVAQGFATLIKEGAVTDFQVKVVIADKSERLVHINASLIYDDNNNPVAAQGIVRDITELKNLEIQKEKLLNKLEKSNEELQEYAHIVSHDLKSPLRSIDALVSWLKEDNKGKLDEVSEQNLTLIQTTLEKMELLISDVLNYSSVAADNNISEEVDLHALVTDLIPILFVPEHIEIKLLKELPTVQGDKTKLQQVFQNLISNGIKFNDKSKGLVAIDVIDQDSHYRFSIKDNGIGIEPKFQDKVFKIFNTLNEREDSTGIGLSIVKKIVNLHEGEIWIESNLGEGATFFFTLKNNMLISSTNIDEIIKTILGHVQDNAVLISVGEHTEIDMEKFVTKLQQSGLQFMGGLFPRVIHGNSVLEKGIVINTLNNLETLFLVDNISTKNYKVPEITFKEEESYSLFTYVDGLTSNISHYLSELYENYGMQTNYFGGGAGSLTLEQKPCVFLQ